MKKQIKAMISILLVLLTFTSMMSISTISVNAATCKHSYGADIVTKKAGFDASYDPYEGSYYKKCKKCGHKTRSMPIDSPCITSPELPDKAVYNGKTDFPAFKKGEKYLADKFYKNSTPDTWIWDYCICSNSDKYTVGYYKYGAPLNLKYYDSKNLDKILNKGYGYVDTYEVIPKGTTITGLSKSGISVTVKYNKQINQTTGYKIQYSTSSNFKNTKTVTVDKNSTSKKISGLIKGKTYYFRIRTYKKCPSYASHSEFWHYSKWSGSKSIKI